MRGARVQAEGLLKSFGRFRALGGVSLDVAPGEFFSILGPSGCGKTTLLRLLAGFEEPDAGSVRIDGADVTALPPEARPINTVFQNYALFPHLDVFENVAFPLRLRKTAPSEIADRVALQLARVRLSGHERKFPGQLSGGQRQRVAIARALASEPRALLLDEPLSALDAKLRQQVLVELDALHAETGLTFILVTHDQEEALAVSDRIAVLKDGGVLQVGSPRDIYESPVDSFVADFIGDSNLLKATVASDGTMEVEGLGRVEAPSAAKKKGPGPVRLGLRPERIRFLESVPAAGGAFPVKIEEVIYRGDQRRFHARTASGLEIRVAQPHPAPAGEPVPRRGESALIGFGPEDPVLLASPAP